MTTDASQTAWAATQEIQQWKLMEEGGVDEQLASKLEQLTRSCSSTDGSEIISPSSVVSTDIMPTTSKGQNSKGVYSLKMKVSFSESYFIFTI
ncbi:MAG: hypothetical protein EZS28_054422, partial [Streblomastix strix]